MVADSSTRLGVQQRARLARIRRRLRRTTAAWVVASVVGTAALGVVGATEIPGSTSSAVVAVSPARPAKSAPHSTVVPASSSSSGNGSTAAISSTSTTAPTTTLAPSSSSSGAATTSGAS
jgi:hypothetical protein